MDASIYSAMSAAKQFDQMHTATSSNIANANTSGYKADQLSFSTLYLNASNGVGAVAYPELSSVGVDLSQGALNFTNNKNDLVANGESFFKLRAVDGEEFFSKSISLLVDSTGTLVNADGSSVLGMGGETINVGDARFNFNANGEITSQTTKGVEVLGTLSTFNLSNVNALKSTSGRVIGSEDNPPTLNNNSQVLVGYKESGNVNTINEMARLMTIQKEYELSTKVMTTSKSLSSYSNKLIND